jgi:AcrR family transcriptional regulator
MDEGLRERQRQQRIDAILDAAVALMDELGYEAVTINEIAARAATTKPTVYAYFPTKESIAAHALARLIRRSIAVIDSQEPTRPPLDRIADLLRLTLRRKLVDGTGSFASAAVLPNLHAYPDFCDARTEHRSRLATLIDAGKADGSIRPELDTRVVLQVFTSILRDSEYVSLLRQEVIDGETVIETLLALLIHGMQPCPTTLSF